MARKENLRAIEEDFQGLDYKASDLRKSYAFFKDATNCSYSNCDGIVKRPGVSAVSGRGLLLGLHTYSYLDRETGASEEELLGFGAHVFRLKEYSFSFTRASGTYRATFTRDANGKRIFSIFLNGSGTASFVNEFDDATDSGTASGSGASIYSLCVNITGAGGYTVTYPTDTLVVQSDVTQTSSSNPTITFSYGTPSVGKSYTVHNRTTSLLESVYMDSSPTPTTAVLNRVGDFHYKADDVFGSGGAYAGSITTTDTGWITSASACAIYYRYWEPIPWGYYSGASKGLAADAITLKNLSGIFEEQLIYDSTNGMMVDNRYPLIQGENLNNKFYFGGLWDSSGIDAALNFDGEEDWANVARLYCYDGEAVYRAGIPAISTLATLSISPNVTTTARWKYCATLSYIDANGVEWESGITDIVQNNTGGTGGGTTLTFSCDNTNYDGYESGLGYFDMRSGFIQNATATATIEVNGRSHTTANRGKPNVQVGATLYFRQDGATSVPWETYETRTVTAIDYVSTPSTITIDSALPYTTAVGEAFSTGMFVNIYRTKEYGGILYLVKKLPFVGCAGEASAIITTVDTVVDTDLFIEYQEPFPGEEHQAPPPMSYLCSHQGALVLSGSPAEPNTVRWSGIDGIEYFPRAFNSLDIPSTTKGAITAIASDSDDRLAVFKARGYYEVNGDLATKSIGVRVVKEGDYGISSQLSLKKVDGGLIGVGERGVLIISNGDLYYEPFGTISPVVRGRASVLDLTAAIAVNDVANGQYILNIPANTVATFGSQRLTLVYHYEKKRWLNWSNQLYRYDFNCGATIYEGVLYGVSYTGFGDTSSSTTTYSSSLAPSAASYKFKTVSVTKKGGELFVQNTSIVDGGVCDFSGTIPWQILTSFENFEDPSQFKSVHTVRVWLVPPVYITGYENGGSYPVTANSLDAQYVGNSITIRSFADWSLATSAKISERTVTLSSTAPTPYVDLPLRDTQVRSLAVQITTADRKPVGITAIEYIFSTPITSESKRAYGKS